MKAQVVRYYYTAQDNLGPGTKEWQETYKALVVPGDSSYGPHTFIVPKGQKIVFLSFFFLPPRRSAFEDKIVFIRAPFNTPLPEKGYEIVAEVEVSDDFVRAARNAASVFDGLEFLEASCRLLLE